MSESIENTVFDTNELNFDDFQIENSENDMPFQQTPPIERDLSFFKGIPVVVTLEVASKEITLGELMKAGEGTVIELDKLNGEPLDVKVNGSLMGHAEIVIVNDKYGLHLTDVLSSTLTDDTVC
ncbi:flagellar motor switch protein FliN [Vibrio mimicus]|uniref:Flagellar motor switch protein FliN n=2 Tax=Vibrio mimicus TaxID=674 RepID=D2YBK5_VIBMI|nr:flagellar motor switch protein FliN [Vibrio mimicus]EEW07872.1 flagellar motor switch protein [Vibrio mimicus VM603]EEW09938.1 flagellar motor switch protein [Vibrio mimicus VM573]EEY36722.1 flagellar motor switch protein FliN [Vibrio mimicus MB451]EGU19848.1 flagellar motor switch protein [Vibrio mimicus SX-4]KFE31405.1 flagellar motor switch protein FliN [Vibrio mimicus]